MKHARHWGGVVAFQITYPAKVCFEYAQRSRDARIAQVQIVGTSIL